MAPIWKPKDPKILKGWINDILTEASDTLTDWESRFIADMDMRLTVGSTLTESQEQKLEEIYAEKTS